MLVDSPLGFSVQRVAGGYRLGVGAALPPLLLDDEEEAVDVGTCLFTAGSNSLRELAVHVAVKGCHFGVLDPPELVPVLREVRDRLDRAATMSDPSSG